MVFSAKKKKMCYKAHRRIIWKKNYLELLGYCELPDVQAGCRKGRGTRDQISNIC